MSDFYGVDPNYPKPANETDEPVWSAEEKKALADAKGDSDELREVVNPTDEDKKDKPKEDEGEGDEPKQPEAPKAPAAPAAPAAPKG